MSWVASQWERRCATPSAEDASSGSDALPFACSNFAYPPNKGPNKHVPEFVLRYLEAVKPWPAP